MPKPKRVSKKLVDERKRERRKKQRRSHVPKGYIFPDEHGKRIIAMHLSNFEKLNPPKPPIRGRTIHDAMKAVDPVVIFTGRRALDKTGRIVERRSGRDRRVKDLGRKARGKVKKKK